MYRRSLPALLVTPAVAQTPVTVFAAASLADGLRALVPLWQARGQAPFRVSLAASSALARQIEQGAPADVFASADEAWMDFCAARGLIVSATRRTALGNTLVLVGEAPRAPVVLTPGLDWAGLLGPNGRLAIADPAHVPAGRYARAALTSLGAWSMLAPRLARAENVRAALLLVQRGEAPLGIVYATDVGAAPGLRALAAFPPGTHPPITYPFALTTRAAQNAQAATLLDFLTGPEAMPVWHSLGFTAP